MRQLHLRNAASGRAALAAVLAACTLGVVAACSTPRRQIVLNEQETAAYRSPGTSTIEGQVVVQTRGNTFFAANGQVRLTPVTTASTQYVDSVVLAGETKAYNQEAGELWWFATADTEGRFRFADLPAGDYYVTCVVAWTEEGAVRKGIAYARARVGAGETVQVRVVTRPAGAS